MTINIRNWLGRSLTRKFTFLLVGFLVLQIVQLSVGIFSLHHLGEEATLINDAGKQRMRLLLMQLLVHKAADAEMFPADRERLDSLLAEQDSVFVKLRHHAENPLHGYLGKSVADAHAHWESNIKPLLAAPQLSDASAARAIEARLDVLLPEQLVLTDRMATEFQQNASDDSRDLAWFQAAMLGLSLALGIAGMLMARHIVTLPLRRLIRATDAIAGGAYERRVDVRTRDELGDLAATFNRMAAAVGEKTARITTFNQVAAVITSSLSIKEIIEKIMYHGCEVCGAKAACLAFYDEQTGRFNDWVTHGLSDHFVQNMSFRPGGLADETFTAGTYILSNDRPGTKHQLSKLARDEGIRSFLCLPLTSRAGRLGVIYFYRTDRDHFLADEIDLLKTFAHLAAEAIENARLHAQVDREARTDALTGLLNRRAFDRRLDEEQRRAQRYGKPYALMMIDIDYFKRINDSYGHPAGDAVLKAIGRVFTEQFRDVDIVARYGGEEFAVILPEISGGTAKAVAERVRRAIAGTPFTLPDGREIGVTASIGVSCYPSCAGDATAAVATADQALYTAKQAGRNRALLYSETLKARIEQDPGCIVAMLNENLDNLRSIVTAVSTKGAFFHKHTDMVEQAALKLAQALRLSANDTEALKLASRLHDIGMAVIPDAVLNKTTNLTEEEWAQVRRHPAAAADWLEQVPALKHLAPLVRHHHERFDGGGYPDGLKGGATPYLARVLAVADAYASMVAEWPGRAAGTPEAAVAALRAGAGTQFDPEIVAAFVTVLEKKPG